MGEGAVGAHGGHELIAATGGQHLVDQHQGRRRSAQTINGGIGIGKLANGVKLIKGVAKRLAVVRVAVDHGDGWF